MLHWRAVSPAGADKEPPTRVPNFLPRAASLLTHFTERYVPTSLSIACILTLITFGASLLFTEHGLSSCIQHWAEGFWKLLEFGMQMSLMLVTGYMVAVSPLVGRVLAFLANLIRSPRQAVAAMAIASMLFAWVHWGVGLIGSAIFLRYLVRRHPEVDFRVMVAVAYFGLGTTWHAGLSASAPLLSATSGHFLEDRIGVIPLTETVFAPFNLALCLVVVLALTGVAVLLHPARREDRFKPPAEFLGVAAPFQNMERPTRRSLAAWIDYSYAINLLIGVSGMAWLARQVVAFQLHEVSINTVNFLFFMTAILLHPHPASLAKAAEQAVSFIHGIVIQFPLYAGIYGVIQGTGLSEIIGDGFVSVASRETFPAIVYWYSGFINYFVPSGGGKWAIEAPYLISSAAALGVPTATMLISYAWGDMMTNLLQPFWCIPLLAVAKVEFREILGYEIIAFLVYAAICSLAFLLLPSLSAVLEF